VERSQRRTRYEFLLDIAVPWIDLQEPNIRDVLKAAIKHLERAAVAVVPTTPAQGTSVSSAMNSSHSLIVDAASRCRQQRTPEDPSPSPVEVMNSPVRKRTKGYQQIATPSPIATPDIMNNAPSCTDNSLKPNGSLRERISHFGNFHCPEIPEKTRVKCALHHWFNRDWQYYDGILKCSICQVHLCVPCFKLFHAERDLVEKKEIFMKQVEDHWNSRKRKKS
jgi:hypothetical protein